MEQSLNRLDKLNIMYEKSKSLQDKSKKCNDTVGFWRYTCICLRILQSKFNYTYLGEYKPMN